MKNILRAARENKGIKPESYQKWWKLIRLLSANLKVVHADLQRPTLKTCQLTDIELTFTNFLVKEKILHEISNEEFALDWKKHEGTNLKISQRKQVNKRFIHILQLIEELKIVAHQLE
jgi:hypothetical protein